jgi:hypothetical protein
MVKIYTHFSDSHKTMYEDYFKPSLRKLYSKDEVTISGCFHQQTTHDGMFMSPGWLDSMDIKLDTIITAINDNKNSWFIFSDCDVQFFKPFVEDLQNELQDADIVCQNDCDSLCAGFFACKGNDKTLSLFQTIKQNFKQLVNDQVALNKFSHLVSYKLLDKKKYYTIGNFFKNIDGTHNWDNQTNIIPPVEILVHHANYVKGVNNKLKLLDLIKSNIYI